MFEKEAEEYAIENYETCLYDDLPYTNDSKAIEQAFENGAEFGYNKAFVEADKNLKAILTDFNKANEWHYPSKGEYPKECENVLCYCKVVDVEFYSIGHTIIGGDNKIRWWSSNRSEELNVYAWKEIVLPKEIEEK